MVPHLRLANLSHLRLFEDVSRSGKFSSEVPIGESKVEIRVPKVVGKKKLYDTPDSPSKT
jgi:hypothetical protein